MHIYNRRDQKEKRQALRRARPAAERVLWEHLRGAQRGLKFRRQYSLGFYVVDFYCPHLKLAIEIDGPSHEEQVDYDRERQRIIETLGIEFLRFTNAQVFHERDAVLDTLAACISRRRRERYGIEDDLEAD